MFTYIRIAADGKDYVYDITKINKLKNGPHIRQATNNSAYDNSGIHKENISSNKENVNNRYSLDSVQIFSHHLNKIHKKTIPQII